MDLNTLIKAATIYNKLAQQAININHIQTVEKPSNDAVRTTSKQEDNQKIK